MPTVNELASQAIQTLIDAYNSTTKYLMHPIYNVMGFKAKGDGVTDDTVSIQDAIDAAYQAGGGIVFVPEGTFIVTSPLKLYSHVSLQGVGDTSKIKASQSTGWLNASLRRAIVELVDVDSTMIKNITIDHAGTGRPVTKAIAFTVLLSKATKCLIENVTFLDGGYDGSYPTGPVVLITANEQESVDRDGIGVAGGCSDNIIRSCRFILPGTSSFAFGVRILSDWQINKDVNSFLYTNENNIIENCFFDGDYNWNMIEAAGPVSRRNKILHNVLRGKTLGHVDFDKGASYNIADGNHISRAGTPNAFLNVANRLRSCISDHGNYDATTIGLTYTNSGNVIVNNVIEDASTVESTKTDENGIYLFDAKDGIVSANVIKNINYDGFSTPSGNGIYIHDRVYNYTVAKNKIRKVKYGIIQPSNSLKFSGLQIINNDVTADSNCIQIGGSTSGSEGDSCIISGNVCKTTLTNQIVMLLIGSLKKAIVSNNQTVGGYEGINCSADDCLIQGNVVQNASSRSFRISSPATKSTLIGNISRNPVIGDAIVSAGTKIISSANSFYLAIPAADAVNATSFIDSADGKLKFKDNSGVTQLLY